MWVYRSKALFVILTLTFLSIAACSEKEKGTDHYEFVFGEEGKTFEFLRNQYLFGEGRSVFVEVPEGAVRGRPAMLHYFDFYLNDKEDLPHFYINWWGNDISLFRTDAGELLKPALVRLPYPDDIAQPEMSAYRPFKIKTDGSSDLFEILKDTSLWEEVPEYEWHHSSKELRIETADLNAIYLIARRR